MTGGKRLAPILVLLGLCVVGALWLSRTDEPPVESPEPPARPVRRLSPAAPRPPKRIPDLPPASIEGLIRGDHSRGAWLALTGKGVGLRADLEPDGGFLFPEVPAGVDLELWIGPDPAGARICRLMDGLVLEPRERRRLELDAPCPASIRGLVTDESGTPLADVRVAVLHLERDWRQVSVPVAAVTGDDGRFFVGFEEGRADVPFRIVLDKVAAGFILREEIVDPAALAVGAEVVVALEKGLRIGGTALGPRGEPLVGAKVHILEDYRGDPRVRRPVEGLVHVDENGYFTDDAYLSSVYRIVVTGKLDGGEFAVVRRGVHAGDEDVRIRFKGYGSASIAFGEASTLEPFSVPHGALEFVYGVEGDEEEFVPWADLAGKPEARFERLPEGHYRVLASSPYHERFLSDLVYVTAGEDLGLLRFDLTPR